MSNKRTLTGTLLLGLLALGGTFSRDVGASTEDGSCIEVFELENFQPLSPTFGQMVESTSYRERTTVVMFLASW